MSKATGGTWYAVYGHKKGSKGSKRLGSLTAHTKTEALKRARKDFKKYTITKVG